MNSIKENSKIANIVHEKLNKILPFIDECSSKVLPFHRNKKENLNIVEKDNQEGPLTQADRISHQFLTKKIEKLFPKDTLVSEEGQLPPHEKTSEFTWCIDPIDGTKAFIRGHTDYMIQVGLLYQGHPVLGILHQPNFQTTLYGSIQKGVWLKTPFGQRKVLKPSLKKNRIRIATSKDHSDKHNVRNLEKTVQQKITVIEASSVGYKTLLCLTNIADAFFYVQPLKVWDVCAPHAIILETQGVVIGKNEETLQYNNDGNLNSPISIFCWDQKLLSQIKQFTYK